MVGRLRLSATPGAGETPLSFLSRLARLNAKSVRSFCSDVGIRLQDLVDGRQEAVLGLAGLGGVAAGGLVAEAMVRQGLREYVWRGERILVGDLCRLKLRACPGCLAADLREASLGVGPGPYGRTTWLLRYVRTCPVHDLMLVQIPLGHAATHDFAGSLSPFIPGHTHSELPRVPRTHSDFERYLLARLDGSPDPATPWLNGLPIGAVADACEGMGAVVAFGRAANTSGLDQRAWHLAGDLGFQVARDGPASIRRMLAAWDAGDNDVRAQGQKCANTYGTFQTLLFGRHRRIDLDPLREVIFDHEVRSTPVGPGDVVHGRKVTLRHVHSIATASRETGVPVLTLRRLLRAAGAIDGSSDGRVAGAVLFDAATYRPLLDAAARSITGRKLGPHMGVGTRDARALVEAGLIKPLFASEGTHVSQAMVFDTAGLDGFLRRLVSRAELVRSDPPGTCSVVRAAARARCGLATLAGLILDGKLPWVGRREGVEGLAALRVNLGEVKRLTGGGDPDLLTPPELGERIGLDYERTSLLIASGLIASRRRAGHAGRRAPRLVTREEASSFEATYVTLGRIGREWRMHPNRCKSLLRKGGVRAVFSSPRPHISVYLRDDVSRMRSERAADLG